MCIVTTHTDGRATSQCGSVSCMEVDVAIIGGGIAGLCAGAWLADDRALVVVEAEDSLGYHATGRSAAAYTECYGPETIRRLAQASRQFLVENEGITTPLPVMFVAKQGDDDTVTRLLNTFRPLVPTLEHLGPDDVAERCSAFDSGAVAGGVFEPRALNIDVHALQTMYARRVRSAGHEILTSSRVTHIQRTLDDRWALDAGGIPIVADVLVNASGAWADTVAAMASVNPIGLTPLLRSVFVFEGRSDSPSWPLVVDADEQWYFKPEGPNVLGSGASELPSEPTDARPPEIDIAMGIEKINNHTNLAIRSVQNTWAGLRTFSADRNPVVGFDSSAPGFFWLAGQGGYGIKTSPVLGELAASLIVSNTIPQRITSFGITRAELAPERFAR